MGKLTRKCCLGCPAFNEYNYSYNCALRREIVGEEGRVSLSIPYSKYPCKRPKSNKEYIQMLNDLRSENA